MLGLDGFNSGVTRVAKLLPLMLQAPRFFAGQIKLGDMHQTVQALTPVDDCPLHFLDYFMSNLHSYQARLNRFIWFYEKNG